MKCKRCGGGSTFPHGTSFKCVCSKSYDVSDDMIDSALLADPIQQRIDSLEQELSQTKELLRKAVELVNHKPSCNYLQTSCVGKCNCGTDKFKSENKEALERILG